MSDKTVFVEGEISIGIISDFEERVVCVGGRPLAEALEWDLRLDGERVWAVWGFSKEMLGVRELSSLAAEAADGLCDIEWDRIYSEVSGDMLLGHRAKIGGHDLEAIFSAHAGEFVALVVSTAPIDLLGFAL